MCSYLNKKKFLGVSGNLDLAKNSDLKKLSVTHFNSPSHMKFSFIEKVKKIPIMKRQIHFIKFNILYIYSIGPPKYVPKYTPRKIEGKNMRLD